jgi:hypothetical protein
VNHHVLSGAAWLLAPCVVATATQPASLSFEDTVNMSDRIVIGTVQGSSGGSVRLPDGREIGLGIKDPSTGLVFTPYRVRISECLFDNDGSCTPGDFEVLIPGGTVYETVEHQRRLRTWEVVGAAGAPLPPAGEDVVLFLTKRNGRYLPINDIGARVPVDRSLGLASVVLRFASPRLLSAAGREAARGASVPLARLHELIAIARQVSSSSSGMRDANPRRSVAGDVRAVRKRRSRIRAGQDPQRRESALALGYDRDSVERPCSRRRPCGS